jgi:LysM repeat protein
MNASFLSPRWLAVPALAAALAGTSGCMTYDDYAARAEMGKEEDVLLVKEDVRKLAGRIEAVELELQRLENQVETSRSGQDAQTRARLDELDGRIKGVETARENDKREIIDKLTAKITEIVSKSASSSSSSAAKRQNTKRSSSDVGYEHEVKSGESLSAIAAAYGVTLKVLMDNNGITDPNKLRVGQKLFVPQ